MRYSGLAPSPPTISFLVIHCRQRSARRIRIWTRPTAAAAEPTARIRMIPTPTKTRPTCFFSMASKKKRFQRFTPSAADEVCHQQLKEELGLDHFEGRSWSGL